jgi:hypothetical protein
MAAAAATVAKANAERANLRKTRILTPPWDQSPDGAPSVYLNVVPTPIAFFCSATSMVRPHFRTSGAAAGAVIHAAWALPIACQNPKIRRQIPVSKGHWSQSQR